MLNMKMGDLEAAVSRFEDCVEKDETLSNGYFFMAQCYDAMGRKGEALEAFKTYLPLAPDSVVAESVEAFINRLEVEATGQTTLTHKELYHAKRKKAQAS